MSDPHIYQLDTRKWYKIEIASYLLEQMFPSGFSVRSLRQKIKDGHLPKGQCWIDSGDSYSINPAAVLDYIQSENVN